MERIKFSIILSFLFVSFLFAGNNYWSYIGPYNMDAGCIAVDPIDSERIYVVGYYSGGIGAFKSIDEGENWDFMDNGLPEGVSLGWISIDPVNTNILYISAGLFAPVLVYKSIDYGESWFPSENGLVSNGICIAIDPTNSETIYISENGPCMAKSIDSGDTWFESGEGIDNPYTSIIAINPHNPQILYVNSRPLSGHYGRIYKSINGAESWFPIMDGLELDGDISHPTIDPTRPDTIYIATSHGPPLISSVFKSINSGESWFEIDEGFPDVGTTPKLAIDSNHPDTLYAGLSWAGERIYRTINAGESWENFSDSLPVNIQIRTITVDPTNSNVVYAGTFYHGVWKYTYSSVGVEDKPEVITTGESKLYQNHPNPFQNHTTISFSTTEIIENRVIGIYNIKGERIRKYSIFNNQSSIFWDGKDENNKPVSAGIYLYKLKTGTDELVRKCVLID